jgi:hypothetical protein
MKRCHTVELDLAHSVQISELRLTILTLSYLKSSLSMRSQTRAPRRVRPLSIPRTPALNISRADRDAKGHEKGSQRKSKSLPVSPAPIQLAFTRTRRDSVTAACMFDTTPQLDASSGIAILLQHQRPLFSSSQRSRARRDLEHGE